jgi:tetratricopeptide (TPR) repeat protein
MEPLAETRPAPSRPSRPPRERPAGGLPGSGSIIEEEGKVIPRRTHTRIGFFGIGGSKRPPAGSIPGWVWIAIGVIAMVIVIIAAVSITNREAPFSIPGGTQLQAKKADSLYQALKTDSLNANGYVKLADLLYDTQNFERAVTYYRRALSIDRSLADAQVDLAVSLHQTDRSGEALAELEDVLSRYPEHVIAHFDRGVILESLQRYDDAVVEYNRVLEIDANPEIHDIAHQRLEALQRRQTQELPPGHP